jgi:uncharacterized membrane protein
MASYVYNLLKTAAIILLVDLLWLGSAGIYARNMAERIQGSPIRFRIIGAAVVYVFLAYMLLETTSYKQAFMYGVSIYAVYDFTNYALFDQYDWKFALADTLWGGVLFVLARRLLKEF